MTLRIKTLLVVFIVTLLLAGLLAVASKAILFRSYIQLEEKRVSSDIDVALSALDSQQVQLNSFVQDWAAWDATYQFAQDQNAEYINLNLLDETFVNMNLNFFAVVSPDKKVVFEKAFNLQTLNETTPPNQWVETIDQHIPFAQIDAQTSSQSDLIMLNGIPWIIATHPIISSLYEGPMQGVLVVGRALTLAEIQRISESIHLPIEIREISKPLIKDDFENALESLGNSTGQKVVLPIDEEWIAGYTLLNGHDNQPHLILRVMEAREFYHHAKIFNRYFILAVVIIGLATGLISNTLIEHKIIRRLDVIILGMDQARTTRDLSTRIELPGNDEIAILARKINQTFAALQSSNQALVENQERLNYESLHDSLTHLPNRIALIQYLNEIGENKPDGCLIGILFIDLDRFKLINDSFNHQVGDEILIKTGDRIINCLPTGAFVARMGGDEFAIVLNALKNENEAFETAEKILNAIKPPFDIQGRNVFLSASIGIATTINTQQVDVLLRNADLAMYQAKSRGKARFEIYTASMHTDSLSFLQLENDLRRGIEHEEFFLHYQPIIRLDSGQIDMVEVLVRWQHPTRGLLYPGEFLPVAEETGLIVPLNEWVMVSAARQLMRWHNQGYSFLNLAVNVPAQQLQDPSFKQFIDKYRPRLADKAYSVQVEITESTAMADFNLAYHHLALLRECGVRIAIDDFGTGYSSLVYLQRFPVDNVKIDKSFLQDYQGNATLLDAIIAMGHAMGLEVTAEGVETREQLEFLRSRGCDKAQGYLFCRPVSKEKIEELLDQYPKGNLLEAISKEPLPTIRPQSLA